MVSSNGFAFRCRIIIFVNTKNKGLMKEAGYVYILTNPSFKEDWVKLAKVHAP